MPVHPTGIPPYHIQKPCTMGDLGTPSRSMATDLQRVLDLIQDERHLTAHALFTSIQERIQQYDHHNDREHHHHHQSPAEVPPPKAKRFFSRTGTTTSSSSATTGGGGGSSHPLTNGKHNSTNGKQQQQQEEEEEEIVKVKEIIQSKKHIFETLENRCQLFRTAQQNFAATTTTTNHDATEWIYASTHFGITTYYRREPSDQSLSIKLEGTVEGAALFEQICVLKEVDLHYLWSPFCTSSLTIANLDKLDIVGWFLIGMPNFGLARDGCYRAIGCDNIEEDGSIILTGRGLFDHPPYISTTTTHHGATASTTTNGSFPSIESNHHSSPDDFLATDPILDKLDIPPVPARMGSGRMTIRKFDAIIHVTSPTSVRTQLIANMNPNISFLPNSLLEFGMKHLASVVLSKLQNAAKKATLHPVTNLHAIKMREEKEFYQTWLLEKFKSVCAIRGWELPPVAAFNLTETEATKAQRYMKNRAQTFPSDNVREEDDNDITRINSLSHDELDANTEVMSALSTDSGRTSVWSNNPIASYLRETERKIQQRKADAETESRQRAVQRLQPKARSFSDEERLNALRLAKYRRLDKSSSPPSTRDDSTSAITTTESSKSYSQRLAYQLYDHSPRTRYIIVLTLVGTLLLMLHTGVVVESSKMLSTSPSMPWYMNRSKDIGTIIYILLCTIPHFLLVNVSLVYAFDALDIGSKSGRQAKTYFSDHVYGASIVASFGIATISIILAMLKVFIRTLVWSSVKFWGLLGIHVFSPVRMQLNDATLLLPTNAIATSVTIVALIKSTIRTGIWIVSFITSLVWRCFFESNIVGQGVARCISAGIATGMNAIREAYTFIHFSVKAIDGEVAVTSWRVEAFMTARFLFMNTAVFLLVTLTLFYLTSRKPTPTVTSKEPKTSNTGAVVEENDNKVSPKPQLADRYATIPEEGVVEVVDLHSFNPVESASSDGATTARRRRFRFRTTKTSSAPNMSTPVRKKHAPIDRHRLQHTKTM